MNYLWILLIKEVISLQCEEANEFLCSYHMKKTVFWAIQQNMLPHWRPQNFLAGFWVCFKLLLKLVYEGICPNFSSPKNLFLSKIHGSPKNSLFFFQLNEMYSNGLACLLQCSSIRSYIIDVFYNPRLSICTNENVLCCEVDCHKELFNASHICEYFHHDRRAFGEPLGLLEQVIGSHLTQYQVVHLQKLTAEYLQKTTSILLH